jgi:precorrin-2 dehydrogenase/sirohydrochlorin ferrochelatase
MKFYPVILNVENRKVVVIGGGVVALRKIQDLLLAGAVVRVVSPEVHPDISALRGDFPGRLEIESRAYAPGDLDGAWLIYSATNNSTVNEMVFREAESKRIFINAVDDPENCSFIVPSVIKRGDLLVSVSTSGSAPAMSARLKREIEKNLPENIDEILQKLKEVKRLLKDDRDYSGLSSAERGEILKKIINSDTHLAGILGTTNIDELKFFLNELA